MSVGVFTSPVMLDNVTHSIFHGTFGAVNNGGIVGAGGSLAPGGGVSGNGGHGYIPTQGKHCVDINERLISPGMHFVPGPDECTLCACDDGEPKWCKAVYCAPPQDCKSFRVGKSCCDFICMDDGGPNTGGPYLSRPVEIANFVPKVVIAAVTAMLSLSLLFFLIHRLRQRHIQARARRSTQMCDECDDTRSLDFSNDFFEHRMNSPHLYPPQYLAWWKPPSSYFPPRGEAPPPYEEAMMATTSIGGGNNIVNTHTTTTAVVPYGNNNNNLPSSIHTSGGVGGGATATPILNDIPIIVPPPVLPPGPQVGGVGGARSSPAAIQRLASAIANTTNSGGSTTCCGVVTTANSLALSSTTASPQHHQHHHHHPLHQTAKIRSNPSSQQGGDREGGKVCQVFKIKSKSSRSKSSKAKDRRHSRTGGGIGGVEGEPQPGTSRIEETDAAIAAASAINNVTRYSTGADDIGLSPRPFRLGSHHHHHLPHHGPAPPTYEDAIYSLHPTPRSSYYSQHRHSLTLPPRRFLDDAGLIGEVMSEGHLYPHVIVHGSSGLISGSGAGPHTCYTEEELLRRAQHHQTQRYSLQFNVGGGGGGSGNGSSTVLGGGNGNLGGNANGTDIGRGDWSSSSSTLSLSTSPNSPVGGRAPSLSSSSESSVSENPPPPPAPTSAPPSSSSSSNNHHNSTARA